jgi:hypothetical protein
MDTPEFIMPITSNRRSHCDLLLAGAGLAIAVGLFRYFGQS